MKETRKEFIINAHRYACSEWKAKIEGEFPELFETDDLKVGAWYRLTEDYGSTLRAGMVFQFIDYQSKDNKRWGCVDHYAFGIGERNYLAPATSSLVPATNDEVEDALIKEAKRRGYKRGVTFKSAFSGNIRTADDSSLYFYDDGDLHLDGNAVLCEGKWAEIVPKVEDTLKVGDWYKKDRYLMVWNGGEFTYGFFEGAYGIWALSIDTNLSPATSREVEDALIKEAKRRGVWNVPMIDTAGIDREDIGCNPFFYSGYNRLWSSYGRVFEKGVWATPFVKEMSIEEISLALGYDVRVKD